MNCVVFCSVSWLSRRTENKKRQVGAVWIDFIIITDDFVVLTFRVDQRPKKMMTPTPEPDAICRKRKNAWLSLNC